MRLYTRTVRTADPDTTIVRRLGRRLAALTVGLLCVLLLALSSIVYGTTQYLFMNSLQHTVQSRALSTAQRLVNSDGLGFPYGLRSGPQRVVGDSGGVYVAIIDPAMGFVGGQGPSGQTSPDPAAAEQALQSKDGDGIYSSRQIDATGPYLIYTLPLYADDGTPVGVIQTSVSEAQYLDSMHTLLLVLLGVGAVGLIASGAISAAVARRALRPIQRSMRRQREFVADAAHELRTPLAIMRTAAELSLTNGDLSEQQTALEQTLAQNAHLTHLVDSLSLLARADSGTLTMTRQPLDLADLVRQTVEGVAILADEREVQLRIEALTPARVLADAGRLRQVVLILLDNALKFTPQGGSITIGVDREGKSVRLWVRDTGPGIDQADLPHIFDRFYRADRARTSEGSGLGLAIAHHFVEAHQGRITAGNTAGGGALFTVVLPAVA